MGLLDQLGSLFGVGGTDPYQDPTVSGMGLPKAENGILPGDQPLPQGMNPVTILTAGQPSRGSGVQDYIGQVIDAYLQIHGGKPIWKPMQDEKLQNQALRGFDTDPIGAIRRLAKVNPKMAIPLYAQLLKGQGGEGKTAAQTASAQSTADKNYGGMFSAYAKTGNAQNWGKLRPILQKIKDRGGLDVGDIPETYDPDWTGIVGNAGMSPYQSERLQDFDVGNQNNAARIAEQGRHNQMTEVASERSRALAMHKEARQMEKAADDIRNNGRKTRVAEKNANTRADKITPPAFDPAQYKGKKLSKNGNSWISNGEAWIKQ